jgi:hypothetical protein
MKRLILFLIRLLKRMYKFLYKREVEDNNISASESSISIKGASDIVNKYNSIIADLSKTKK